MTPPAGTHTAALLWVAQQIAAHTITAPTEVQLLFTLAPLANVRGEVRMSQAALSEATGRDVRSVRRSLDRLAERAILTVVVDDIYKLHGHLFRLHGFSANSIQARHETAISAMTVGTHDPVTPEHVDNQTNIVARPLEEKSRTDGVLIEPRRNAGQSPDGRSPDRDSMSAEVRTLIRTPRVIVTFQMKLLQNNRNLCPKSR